MRPNVSSQKSVHPLSAVALLVVAASGAIYGCAKSSPNNSGNDSGVAAAVTLDSGLTQSAPTSSANSGATGASYGTMPATMASVVNPRLPIPERLGIESGNRVPTSNPKVEDVFAAWTKAGVKMSDPQQFVAATYSARYCSGVKTDGNTLAVSVCEYGNEADAIKGRDYSEKLLNKVPNRKVWRDKTTTLAIIPTSTGADTDALEKKMVDIFTKL